MSLSVASLPQHTADMWMHGNASRTVSATIATLIIVWPRSSRRSKGPLSMSFQECTQLLRDEGMLRINAGEFSMDELEAAAALAQAEKARLIIYNLRAAAAPTSAASRTPAAARSPSATSTSSDRRVALPPRSG